jgi:hypothetical protein
LTVLVLTGMSEFVPLFTEGFDTRDLKEGKALLEELGAYHPAAAG